MTKEEWLIQGIEKGWIHQPQCYQHEGVLVTTEEDEAFFTEEEDMLKCIYVTRVFQTQEEHAEVAKNNPHLLK